MRDGIRAEGVSVSYGRRRVLRGVDLHAPRGRVTGLVGPNGAGKSTLVAALLGLVRIDAGRVRLDGRAPAAGRRGVAYVAQRSTAAAGFPMQVRDLVMLGRLAHLGPWRRPGHDDRARVAAAMDRLGIRHLERRPLAALSGGQHQRAQLARALAQGADLLVLDEPFTGVDEHTSDLLVEVLRQRAEQGAAVLVVAHDAALVARLCHGVVPLDGYDAGQPVPGPLPARLGSVAEQGA